MHGLTKGMVRALMARLRAFGTTARVGVFLAGLHFALYALTFSFTLPVGWLDVMRSAVANTASAVILALYAFHLLRRHAARLPLGRQMLVHMAGATAFTVAWNWLLSVLLGALRGASARSFLVLPLPDTASTWQLLQGLYLYAFVAALAHLAAADAERARVIPDPRPPSDSSRVFVKLDDEIRPIDVDRIVSITGADDYASIRTVSSEHLVRMTLRELETALGDRFIRIHRSRLVNIQHIARAEPAGGGKVLVHMSDGEMISASRAGTRRLREQLV